MNQTDYLVTSDILAGVVSMSMAKLCGKVSTPNLWKPMIESISLSVVGRMGEGYLSGKMWSRAGTDDKTTGVPYIRSDQGRSAIVIFLSSLVVSYVLKNKMAYETGVWNVSADILGSELTSALFETDKVWFAAK